MKLVVIICVEEYAEDARKILKNVRVPAFSESDIQGTHLIEENEKDNWFAVKHSMDSSRLFFTMCDKKKAEEILEEVKKCADKFNEKHVHAFQLAIEKTIN